MKNWLETLIKAQIWDFYLQFGTVKLAWQLDVEEPLDQML